MGAAIRLGVVVETPRHAGLDAALTYASQRPLAPGTLVRVPLGKRQVAGLVWSDGGAQSPTPSEIREITEVCDALPPLPPAWRELVSFAAGVPGWQLSCSIPAVHDVTPLDAHAPTPHVVACGA